jgi:hypothetical protein
MTMARSGFAAALQPEVRVQPSFDDRYEVTRSETEEVMDCRCRPGAQTFSMLALVLGVLLPALATAAEGDEQLQLITDRPDFTESAAAVPPWHVQAEAGVDTAFEGDEVELVVPAALLRVGVYRNVEARVGVPAVSLLWSGEDEAERDLGALELSAKATYTVGSGAVGLLPQLFLPVEGTAYDDVGVGLGVKGLWALELSERVALGGNVGAIATGLGASDVDVTWEYLVSLASGIGLTERLGTFIEVYGIFDQDVARAVFDTGLTYLVWDRFQLDIYAGIDVAQTAGIAGAGIAFLL